jgi:hypothetical protein
MWLVLQEMKTTGGKEINFEIICYTFDDPQVKLKS